MKLVLGNNLQTSGAYYIGGTDGDQEERWEWVSGEPWQFSKWGTGEPNDGNIGITEDYLEIKSYQNGGGVWNDVLNDWHFVPHFAIFETGFYSSATNPDTDGDGLSDGDEINIHGTFPNYTDSDEDGYDDATEIAEASDPKDDQSLPNDGLLAYFPFEGDTNNAVGSTLNLTTYGPVPAQGVSGGAYEFDGENDYMQSSDLVPITGNVPRTVSFWIKPYTTTANDNLLAWGSYAYNGGAFALHLRAYGFPGGGQVFCNTHFTGFLRSENEAFVLSKWHHVVLSYPGDPAAAKFYINGVDATATSTVTTAPDTGSSALMLGTHNPSKINFDGWHETFHGVMDEVRIYTRALSAAEAYDLFVQDAPEPVITQQPSGAVVTDGEGFVAIIEYKAFGTPTVQWYFDDQPITGATGDTLQIASTALSDAGNYYAIVYDEFGTVQSQTFVLSVLQDSDDDGLADDYEGGLLRYELVGPQTWTWSEALAEAQSRGKTLASITSEAEQLAIFDLCNLSTRTDIDLIYLGGLDEASEGTWAWTSGEPFAYTNWANAEPARDPRNRSDLSDRIFRIRKENP